METSGGSVGTSGQIQSDRERAYISIVTIPIVFKLGKRTSIIFVWDFAMQLYARRDLDLNGFKSSVRNFR